MTPTKEKPLFEFAVATHITGFAKKNFPETYEGCERVYIVPDVNDYHILRILKDIGNDYEPEPGTYILEHQMIPKEKRDQISSLRKLRDILSEDDGGNWDYAVHNSLEECLDAIDCGHGINELSI